MKLISTHEFNIGLYLLGPFIFYYYYSIYSNYNFLYDIGKVPFFLFIFVETGVWKFEIF